MFVPKNTTTDPTPAGRVAARRGFYRRRKQADAEHKIETRRRERDLCPPPIAEPNRRTP